MGDGNPSLVRAPGVMRSRASALAVLPLALACGHRIAKVGYGEQVGPLRSTSLAAQQIASDIERTLTRDSDGFDYLVSRDVFHELRARCSERSTTRDNPAFFVLPPRDPPRVLPPGTPGRFLSFTFISLHNRRHREIRSAYCELSWIDLAADKRDSFRLLVCAMGSKRTVWALDASGREYVGEGNLPGQIERALSTFSSPLNAGSR